MSAIDVSSEGGLAAAYISMSNAEASALAADVYGLRGTVSKFATEKDDTFRVNVDDGRKFVLKVANPGEDEDEIDFQVGMMVHIEKRDPAVPVPRVIPDLNGRLYRYMEDGAGQRRIVRVMTYAEGTPLDSTGSNPVEREKVGEVLARMRLALEDFTHSGESRIYPWDVQHLLHLAPLLKGVECAEHRKQLEQGLARYETLAPQIAKLRKQVLHNDFSKSNIVVNHDLPDFVTGIIDFGDSVRTAVAIDVATALLNQLPRDARENPVEDMFAEGKDLLRGYLRIAELTDEELRLIPHLVMARVVARALITLWRVKQFPENATYIMRNTEQGWGQLDWFLSRTIEEVSATLLA